MTECQERLPVGVWNSMGSKTSTRNGEKKKKKLKLAGYGPFDILCKVSQRDYCFKSSEQCLSKEIRTATFFFLGWQAVLFLCSVIKETFGTNFQYEPTLLETVSI